MKVKDLIAVLEVDDRYQVLAGIMPLPLPLTDARMSDPVDALVLDLLDWIGPTARPYSEVMEAWRTSCPRLPVWEEANSLGYLHHEHSRATGALVSVSAEGLAALVRRRRTARGNLGDSGVANAGSSA